MPSDLTIAAYAATWARLHTVRSTTQRLYRFWLTQVWLPPLGDRPLTAITRRDVIAVLESLRTRGLKPGTMRSMLGVFRALLADARDDGLVVDNVATQLGRLLGRSVPRVEPMNRVELATFLDVAAVLVPAQLPLFLTLARSGLRIGEALGLQPGDVDLPGRQVAVARTLLPDGSVGLPKTRYSRRRVDLSQQLTLALTPLVAEADREWLFGTRKEPLPYHRARRAFGIVRDELGMRRALSLHSLRHTYASLLIARGVSPAYVQRQMGHASIALTLNLYGRHVPYRDLAAVDGLDEPA